MGLDDIYNLISPKLPTAYWAFPVGEAPDMPFVCIFETGSNNFGADNKVYHVGRSISVELMTRIKSPTDEATLEEIFDQNDIYWEKAEMHLDDENAYEVVYSLEVK